MTAATERATDPRFDGTLRPDAVATGVRSALLPTIHPGDSHAATLVELAGGDLLCAWFNGPKEGDRDTNIVLSRLPAGGSWTEPVQLSADPDRSEQNPVLFVTPGGDVWLMHTSNEPHDQKTSRVLRRVSTDGGLSWGPSTVMFDEPGTFLRNPVVVMSNGEWLLPAYHCRAEGEYSVAKVSADSGRTWQEYEVPEGLGRVQMSTVETGPGHLLSMFRSRDADRIYASRSTDFGRTWSAPVPSTLPNNNSAIQLERLDGGDLVVVFNDSCAERDQFRWVDDGDGKLRRKTLRTPLTLAVSKDGGETWPHLRNLQVQDVEYLDNLFGYSYPAMLQAADGSLQLAYSYLRKTIKHVVVEPGWVEAGQR